MKCNNCDLNLKRKDCSETEQLECDFEDLFWKYVGQFGILDLLDLMLKNMDIYEKKKVIKKNIRYYKLKNKRSVKNDKTRT